MHSVPKHPGRDRFRSPQKPGPGAPRVSFGRRVSPLVATALLDGVQLVLPRHPSFNRPESHIIDVDAHLTNESAVSVHFVPVNDDRPAKHLAHKMLL